jgi:serine phosphatase RsbU (regulator of sigma subunit)
MVGGDFYDIFTQDGHRVSLLIGDFSDKGLPSTNFMARSHALIMAGALHGSTQRKTCGVKIPIFHHT